MTECSQSQYSRHTLTSLKRLSESTVAISGGCGDIGQATARRLIQEGAHVVLLDRAPSDALSPDLRNDKDLAYLCCDVTDRASVESALREVVKLHGRLDVVIANAGMVANERFLQIDPANLRRTMEVNFFGAFNLAQLAARLMVEQSPSSRGIRGKMLFTGSWVQDMPFPEGTSYISSKAALKMMAMVMAQELASQGVRVNLVAPGIVYAGLSKKLHDADPAFRTRVAAAIPLNEMQTAESVGDAFAFLCSSDSDYMTGSSLLVDGGTTLVKRS
jgi:NAD(P)-dependent dehydrogenase (short-subunit alcohol dehydrogenase family)